MKRGRAIEEQASDVILNVYEACKKERKDHSFISTKNARQRAAEYCGVSQSTISKLVNEKNREKEDNNDLGDADDFADILEYRDYKGVTKSIQHYITLTHEQGLPATSEKLTFYLREVMRFPQFKNSRFTRRILTRLGYRWEKGNNYVRMKLQEGVQKQLRYYLSRWKANR